MERLNYFSPLPPFKSGISDYSAELLAELSRYFIITVYVDGDYQPEKSNLYKIKKFSSMGELYNTFCLYNIGNHHSHKYIYDILQKNKGIVILHDLNLSGLVFPMQKNYLSKIYFLKEVFLNHGIKALTDYLRLYFLLNSNYFEEEYISIKTNAILTKGWNNKEIDKNGSFRWTMRKAGFLIKEKNITEIIFKVQTEFPALLSIKINNQKHKLPIMNNSVKEIRLNIPPKKFINGELFVIKPLSILSRLIHLDKRELGVKVYGIRYKKDNEYKNIELSQKSILKLKKVNPKFLKLNEKIQFLYHMNKKVINSAKAIIVHSDYLKNEIIKINPNIPTTKINEGVYLNKPNISKEKLKKNLNLEKYDFVICSFGKIQKHKHIEKALEAFQKFSLKNKKSVYILIGESDETINIKEIIKRLKLKNKVILLGYIPFEEAIKYIRASDVSINLRYPSTGATSASLIKSLSIGTPSIISDIPENNQFPETCVFKIKKDERELENIVKSLELLKKYPKLRKQMSNNSYEYIKKNHLWKDKAKEISDYIKKSIK